jgi:hypothetical protein
MNAPDPKRNTTEPGFCTRLLQTPLSDLIRGRVTGRGNWETQLFDAHLPAAVTQATQSFVLKQPVRRRTEHARLVIDWAGAKTDSGQDIDSVVQAIQLATNAPEITDWISLLNDPLPKTILDAVNVVVTKSRTGRRTRRSITNDLIQQMRSRLQHGESAPALAAGLTESVALPMLIRQTSSVPATIDISLPESIHEAINDVVRRTRLWTHEKSDVAGELSAHFRDGLESGRSTEELMQSFGPFKTAARLIRRSRLRCRPWPWQVWRRSWQAIVGAAMLLAVGWFVLIVRFRSAVPNVTFDLVAEHDAIAGAIPIVDRAWPLYREGLLKLGLTFHDAFTAYTGEEELISVLQKGPASPEWPQAVDFLNAHSESVDLFLRGTERPRFGFIHRSPDNIEWIRWQTGRADAYEYNPPGTLAAQTLLEHIQELRIVRAFIAGRMFSAVEEGDADTALRCCSAMLRLGEHTREDGLMVSGLCGVSQVLVASKYISWIVQTRPRLFTGEQLRQLNGQLEGLRKTDWEFEAAADNQMFFDELLQHAYSPGGRFTPQGFQYLLQTSSTVPDELQQDLSFVPDDDVAGAAAPMWQRLMFDLKGSEAAAWIADRDELGRKFAELKSMYQKEVRGPNWTKTTSAFTKELTRLQNSWVLRRRYLPLLVLCQHGILNVSFMRQGNSSFLTPLRMRTAATGATVAIALERYRRDHKKWPQNLNELQPEYLNTPPADPMSDQPLQFKLIEGVPHLYSVGPDRVDNGGTPIEPDSWASETAKGDWLLLPVSLD